MHRTVVRMIEDSVKCGVRGLGDLSYEQCKDVTLSAALASCEVLEPFLRRARHRVAKLS